MNEKKITFIGDIMCEPMLLAAAKQKNGTYDFSSLFENTKKMLDASDYVVANLETPLAGADAAYVHDFFSFNAPDEICDAIQQAGIDLVATCNNHCLDRGVEGLKRTISVLDEKGVAHTGTCAQEDLRKEAVYADLGEQKIAIVSYTYGTNYALNQAVLPSEQEWMVNLLRPQTESIYKKSSVAQKVSFSRRVLGLLFRPFNEKHRAQIKKALGMEYNTARKDDYLDPATTAAYLSRLKEDIGKAKENADIVFFYPHLGGQFNIQPGAFSEHVIEAVLQMGCDAVVAGHPHIVQKAEYKNNIPVFYSIGNYSMSPNSYYLLHEHLPNYGLAVHFYLSDKRIQRITFTVLKIVETKRRPLTVYPVNELFSMLKSEKKRAELLRDVAQVYSTVTGKAYEWDECLPEYSFNV